MADEELDAAPPADVVIVDEPDVGVPAVPAGGPFKRSQLREKPRPRRRRWRRLTLHQFRQLEAVLIANGHKPTIDWSEEIQPCVDAKAFALEAIYVICNSGMKFQVANAIYWKCVRALRRRQLATTVFGHPGKAPAIDFIWQNRRVLWAAYEIATNKLAFCATLPWIGPVTQFHLAKNLGVDVAKPDVHLERLADAEGISVAKLCARLARQTGYRVTTIDTILWRACADGYLQSRKYRGLGWRGATEKLQIALKSPLGADPGDI